MHHPQQRLLSKRVRRDHDTTLLPDGLCGIHDVVRGSLLVAPLDGDRPVEPYADHVPFPADVVVVVLNAAEDVEDTGADLLRDGKDVIISCPAAEVFDGVTRTAQLCPPRFQLVKGSASGVVRARKDADA